MRKKIYFAIDFVTYALKGGLTYYSWLLFLAFFVILMQYGLYRQLTEGLIVTNLNDQISWGIYLSNFVFLVGVAAAAVTVVFPSYAYKNKHLHNLTVIGESLAIAAVSMCILFVLAHMGRPDRLWHIIPGIGIFNWPNSMLTWDVLVLNVYLLLNAVGAFYYLYKKYTDTPVNKTFYIPLIYVSSVWALSIHTVTAFLIGTMPARPFWFHPIMPIRFISTAFAAGPAMIIVTFLIIRKNTKLHIPDEAINFMGQILVWCLGIGLFLTLSEIVVELYPSTEHSYGLKYLMFGMNGLNSLVPWFWTSLALMMGAFFMLLSPRLRKEHRVFLPMACIMAFVGIWIEKGPALMLPGMIPSPIGEFAEYSPSWIEIINSAGNWAIGLLIFTILTKGSVGVILGDVKYRETAPETAQAGVVGTKAALYSIIALIILGLLAAGTAFAGECFESREGYTTTTTREIAPGLPNVKCSKTTGGVLWWGDPFDGTEPMGDMPIEADYSHEEAVVKPRIKHLKYYMPCTTCHNGKTVPYPKDKNPRLLKFHQDIVPNSLKLEHGRGAIWCLDCHNPTNRNTLIDHFGREISFNQPQKLCGKCHGQIYRDWRDGIHGKRIGMWKKGGKKRWWVCTECHNPHDVQPPFHALKPEPPPELPKGMTSAAHERHGEGAEGHGVEKVSHTEKTH